MSDERIDIHDQVSEICERFGLDLTYVARIEILPDRAIVLVHRGRDGRCSGTKYIDVESGGIASETLTFRVTT